MKFVVCFAVAAFCLAFASAVSLPTRPSLTTTSSGSNDDVSALKEIIKDLNKMNRDIKNRRITSMSQFFGVLKNLILKSPTTKITVKLTDLVIDILDTFTRNPTNEINKKLRKKITSETRESLKELRKLLEKMEGQRGNNTQLTTQTTSRPGKNHTSTLRTVRPPVTRSGRHDN